MKGRNIKEMNCGARRQLSEQELLLCKERGLDSNSQHPQKKLDRTAHPEALNWEAGDRQVLSGTASLQFSERPCF